MVSSYKDSHGTPATWPLHNISKNVSCDKCHNNTLSSATGIIAYNLTGGRNCINCHDKAGGLSVEGKLVDVASADSSVHKGLNSAASSSNSSPSNFKCWACHGDGNGSESAQPLGSHPLNYRTPKNCDNNDCHSISQSSNKETMIYSHFKNASLNSNPNNLTNYNITTSDQCENCHSNSLIAQDNNSKLAIVSHYASKNKLIDSFNCVYCHLNKDNSEDWGNATLINKDRVGTIEVNKEDNNITLFEGKTVYLGEGYSLKLIEISALRGDALIEIMNKGDMVDRVLVKKDVPYTYERKITIENEPPKTPAVTININTIFTGTKDSFIQFDAYRPRKIHSDRESKDSACFACHMNRYSNENDRYKVIDRDTNANDDEIVYYTPVLLDQNLENKSKIYLDDEDFVFKQLGIMDQFIPVPKHQKYLEDGQTWQISDRYSLRFKASSTDRLAWLEFLIDGVTVEDKVVTAGSFFNYQPDLKYSANSDNITIFTTNVTSVFLGKKDFIILENSELLSTQILETYTNDTTLFGYNTSWLYPGYRFTLGKIPSNLHVPNLINENNNWADCVRCHDTSNNLRITQIDAISSQLGKHSILNAGADNIAILSDTIDKACWACHTEGVEPVVHPPAYIVPRKCASCHKDREMPYYGARYIGDKQHGNGADCEGCHVSESHIIRTLGATPSVTEITSSKDQTNTSSGTGILPGTPKLSPGLSVAYFIIMFLVAYLAIYGFGKKL
jgi:hypothetical protein